MNANRIDASFQIENLEPRTLLSGAATSTNFDYLSDLAPLSASNGFGPVEKDQSNGEGLAKDGNALMIGGRFYRKGLGLNSDAELHYKLAGKYLSFISDVGVDDEVGDAGSVDFQVFADGQKMFDSGVMTGASATRHINIDVSGMNQLTLIVNDAGDGTTDDHADFGNARLVLPTGNPPVVAPMPNVTLDQSREFLSAHGRFSDLGAGPWTGTIDFGDGRARQYLTLGDDNTFSVGHWYPVGTPDTNYTVTVRVSNGGAVGIGTFQVRVNNVPPSNVGLAGVTNPDGSLSAVTGLNLNAGGVFSDPGEDGGETYTATVDYGDGTPIANAAVDGRFFDIQHIYRHPGTYTVTSTVTDSGGERGVGTNTVVVANPAATFVSDLTPATQIGGDRLDRSAAGSRINLDGGLYTKGIGVAADSQLVYQLGGQYKTLTSDVGVDDEVAGAGGAVQFLVYADGQLIFDSGAMTSASGSMRMNVDVTGVNILGLVVVHASDSPATANHADWAGIRLT